MRYDTHNTHVLTSLCTGLDVTCPAQILVIDRKHGPADILIETLGLVLNRELSVTRVDEPTDALRALNCCAFDLIVLGVEDSGPLQLTLLPHLHAQSGEVPVMVVGKHLPDRYQQFARFSGASEAYALPESAADLRMLIRAVAEHYLPAA